MSRPQPTLPDPNINIRTGKPVPARRPNKRLDNPIYEKPKKARAPVLTPISYDLAYGKDSAAQPGMVMFRISVDGAIMRELNMPPEEFLQLAHAMEIVGRAVAADL